MESYPKIKNIFLRDISGELMDGVYNCPEFDYLAKNLWSLEEKLDGTNIRVIYNRCGVFTFRGRTDKAEVPIFLKDKLYKLFHQKDSMFNTLFPIDKYPYPICLYGEGIGRGIQNGGNYISDGVDFILFDIKIGNRWLNREMVYHTGYKLGIKMTTPFMAGTLINGVEAVKNGLISLWGNFLAEGLIARPFTELRFQNGERIICKIKTRDLFKGEKI